LEHKDDDVNHIMEQYATISLQDWTWANSESPHTREHDEGRETTTRSKSSLGYLKCKVVSALFQ